jgi:hypothetical protein
VRCWNTVMYGLAFSLSRFLSFLHSVGEEEGSVNKERLRGPELLFTFVRPYGSSVDGGRWTVDRQL